MGLLTHPWSWAFLLVLLPLIIHWLQLRRTQTLYFPGVHRLQHLLASGQNPDRLRHWVLLLLRTLALLFLVLGFLQASRPQKDSSSKPIAVVLDASPSMLESGGWDRALLSLDKWMSQAPSEVQFCFPQWSLAYWNRDAARRELRSFERKWPRWSLSQTELYAQQEPNASQRYYYISDGFSPPSSGKVQLLRMKGPSFGSNAYLDTVQLVYTADGPVYRVRVGFEGLSNLPEVQLFNAQQLPLQKLAYTEQSDSWATAEWKGSLPIEGAYFSLEDDAWQFDNRLYVANRAQNQIRVGMEGDHSFPRRWVASQPFITPNDTAFDVLYFAGSKLSAERRAGYLNRVESGKRIVLLGHTAVQAFFENESNWAPGATEGESLAAVCLEHRLLKEAFKQANPDQSPAWPVIRIPFVPVQETLRDWEVVAHSDAGTPMLLVKTWGLGTVYAWLGGEDQAFLSSSWAVAFLGMPCLSLALKEGPLYGIIGSPQPFELGLFSQQVNPEWPLLSPFDTLHPEWRKQGGKWALSMNQRSWEPGLYQFPAEADVHQVIAVNEAREKEHARGVEVDEWPSWNAPAEVSNWGGWTTLFFALALLCLAIESVFVFLKERHEQKS